MREILSVAAMLEMALPAGIESLAFEKAKTSPYETKTSFQRDFSSSLKNLKEAKLEVTSETKH